MHLGCYVAMRISGRTAGPCSIFVVTWRTIVEYWASAPQTSFYRQEAKHLSECLGKKWAHMLPGMLDAVAESSHWGGTWLLYMHLRTVGRELILQE